MLAEQVSGRFCEIQTASPARPELDRAGSVESGWTHGWVVSIFGARLDALLAGRFESWRPLDPLRNRAYNSGMLRSAVVLSLAILSTAAAADIELPAPRTEGGKPLMQALKERHTGREFSPEPLPPQTLSNLLWAAWGVNRPDGRRTAPSASNRQEIEVYVAMASGLYLYEAKEHRLRHLMATDLRAQTGSQGFVADAPLNLVYVADMTKANRPKVEDAQFYAAIDTGFIAQNVYLFCASEGLATVVRGLVNREELGKAMKLRPDQRVVVAQTVGYPRKP